MKDLFSYYIGMFRLSVLEEFQYPVSAAFYMIGMVAEPIIYLVVWSSVAQSNGGTVGGYTAGTFAAYYIVWMLVRNMNIVFTPYGWEHRIRHGRLAMALLRPIHPLHNDIAWMAGWKVIAITLWIPIAAIMVWLFQPTFNPTWYQVVAFFVAIWGAYLVRTMFQTTIGLITFWTTRVSAIFELYFAGELLMSGRLVPLSLMPSWVRTLANYFPFQWTFGFPIEALIGNLTPAQLIYGLGAQVFWILFGVLIVNVFWGFAVKRFTSVGN
jgi:ABC-2 type transport system permease protein